MKTKLLYLIPIILMSFSLFSCGDKSCKKGCNWDKGIIIKNATCEDSGEVKYTCFDCEATKIDTIDPIGHKIVTDNAVAATCYKSGLTEGSHCENCGHVYLEQQVIDKVDHNWQEEKIVKEASCIVDGIKEIKCSYCKITKYEYIKATGEHILEDGACIKCDYFDSQICSLKYELSYDGSYYSVVGVNDTQIEEIVIVEEYNKLPIKSISSLAFVNCSKLKKIVIPSSVDIIATMAFIGLEKLENVYYNGTIEDWCGIEFGSEFSNPAYFAEKIHMKNNNNEYYEVKELVIPNTITSIGDNQFVGFSNLEKIMIPDSVISIGNYAFAYTTVNILEIPNSIVQWGKEIFRDGFIVTTYYDGTLDDWCKISFNDSSSNPVSRGLVYINYERLIFMKDSNNQYYEITEIEIPNTITKVGDYQFSGFSNVIDVVILNSATSIGTYAFSGCSSLESVEIPNSVTSIGSSAFYYCSSLESIVIPSSVTSIGEEAFYRCSSLENVYYNGTLEDWCKIEFGNIYSNPMYYAENFYMKNSNNEYYEITSMTEIEIPNTVINIGGYQFCGFDNITSVVIPESVTGIGKNAFSDCDSLENVYYNGTIEDWCNIKFSDYDSNPMYYAEHFYMKDSNNEYYEVTELVIPNTLTSIEYQFYSFDNIVRVVLSNSVISIEEDAFEDCKSLESVYYNGTLEEWCKIEFGNRYSNPMYYAEHFYMKDSNNEYYEVTELEIPNTVTSIGYQFYSFDNITKLIIPNSVTSIGEDAFRAYSNINNVYYNGTLEDWCNIEFSNVYSNPMSYAKHFYMKDSNNEYYDILTMTEFSIPNTMKTINYQFCGLYNLRCIYIPSTVSTIYEKAIYRINNIVIYCETTSQPSGWNSNWNYSNRPVYWGINETNFYEENGIQYILNTETKEATISKYIGTNTDVTIKIKINDDSFKLTTIGESAFAFLRFSNVYFEGTIEDWCNLEMLSTPMSAGCNFYMKNSNNEYYEVTKIEIPNTVTYIGPNNFSGFDNLEEIVIPNSVISIDSYAFENCAKLTKIIIPSTVVKMGTNVFRNCRNITIYCEAESQPEGWDAKWNNMNYPVIWGYKIEN